MAQQSEILIKYVQSRFGSFLDLNTPAKKELIQFINFLSTKEIILHPKLPFFLYFVEQPAFDLAHHQFFHWKMFELELDVGDHEAEEGSFLAEFQKKYKELLAVMQKAKKELAQSDEKFTLLTLCSRFPHPNWGLLSQKKPTEHIEAYHYFYGRYPISGRALNLLTPDQKFVKDKMQHVTQALIAAADIPDRAGQITTEKQDNFGSMLSAFMDKFYQLLSLMERLTATQILPDQFIENIANYSGLSDRLSHTPVRARTPVAISEKDNKALVIETGSFADIINGVLMLINDTLKQKIRFNLEDVDGFIKNLSGITAIVQLISFIQKHAKITSTEAKDKENYVNLASQLIKKIGIAENDSNPFELLIGTVYKTDPLTVNTRIVEFLQLQTRNCLAAISDAMRPGMSTKTQQEFIQFCSLLLNINVITHPGYSTYFLELDQPLVNQPIYQFIHWIMIQLKIEAQTQVGQPDHIEFKKLYQIIANTEDQKVFTSEPGSLSDLISRMPDPSWRISIFKNIPKSIETFSSPTKMIKISSQVRNILVPQENLSVILERVRKLNHAISELGKISSDSKGEVSSASSTPDLSQLIAHFSKGFIQLKSLIKEHLKISDDAFAVIEQTESIVISFEEFAVKIQKCSTRKPFAELLATNSPEIDSLIDQTARTGIAGSRSPSSPSKTICESATISTELS